MGKIVICGDSFSIGIGVEDLLTEAWGPIIAKNYNTEVVNFAKGSSTNYSISLQADYAIEITNLDVNYHEYPPYGPGTYHQVIPHPYIDNPEYRGTLNTENWYGVVEYVDKLKQNLDYSTDYYSKFKGDDKRLLLLREYYLQISDIHIQRKQDCGCLLLSYFKAKKANIPVLLAMDKKEIHQNTLTLLALYTPLKRVKKKQQLKLLSI